MVFTYKEILYDLWLLIDEFFRKYYSEWGKQFTAMTPPF